MTNCKECGRPFEQFMPDETKCLPCDRPEHLNAEEDLLAWANAGVDVIKIVSEFDMPAPARFRALERIRDVAEHHLARVKFSKEGA